MTFVNAQNTQKAKRKMIGNAQEHMEGTRTREIPGEPRKDCVKGNKRHPFSQELEQENNLIEKMY